ncbi:hypothetical protein RFI_28584 [Reticulomyxa filosa]|uniref:CAP-Gly domain-containing protein n=1 Tax=Reticulomyxa filosa TaxID=46433 RepID=X6M484_RETFI|nr:hypothetical protein RFI_28584 [Reticulomyxa filosa]|eukprot:ETO08803.1 hypothetical protein RFI_28584 [Reticulomyxa filosa]
MEKRVESLLVIDVGSIIVLKNGFEEGCCDLFLIEVKRENKTMQLFWVSDCQILWQKSEQFVSVKLNELDENARGGSKNGKRYFRCRIGQGLKKTLSKVLKVSFKLNIFGPELSVERRVPSANVQQDQPKILEEKENELQKEELSKKVEKLQMNDHVEIAAGRTEMKVLDKSLAQGHDGKGKFLTRHGHGLFVTVKDIDKVFMRLSERSLYAAICSSIANLWPIQGGRTIIGSVLISVMTPSHHLNTPQNSLQCCVCDYNEEMYKKYIIRH